MLSRLRTHARHNVVGYLALFFALTGAAYAAGRGRPHRPPGPGPGGALKPGDPAGGDLTGSYPNPSVANGAITPAKLNAGLQFTDAGLPLFPGDCTAPSLPPGWYSQPIFAGSTTPSVSYGRDAFGVVHLRGIAVNCSAPNDIVFTLPPGFRPEDNPHVPGLDFSTGALLKITISSAGDVLVFQAAGGRAVMPSLDGVTFRCGPSGQNGCP
jgi:hypothetical protein